MQLLVQNTELFDYTILYFLFVVNTINGTFWKKEEFSMSKSIEGAIECPFYLEEGNSFIKCEGVLNGTVCTHNFSSNKEKASYETNICSAFGGRKCRHYRAVAVLYDKGVRV
jgi:hypothetical protein